MTLSEQVWKSRTAALRNGRVPSLIKLHDHDVKAMKEELVSISGSAFASCHVEDIKLWGISVDLTSSRSHVLASDGTRFELEAHNGSD